ncbi:MAG: hypothetical protein J6W98_05960 [Bacteroidales bacterium]|nr:hypothetical protein [Bacteroidales bacterium]
MASHFYHCATKGFDHSILFANVREFIAGMNRIALCKAHMPEMIVLAFCLMDNHVHFILYGTREDCLKWMALYHKLTMMWQRHHREENPVDECWEYDAWQIYDEDELREKVAYVFRNPTVARMGFTPEGYRWSSARLVFSDESTVSLTGRRIGSMSSYEIRKAFETRIALPEDWLLLPDGLIWPGNYTETGRVERLFEHPRNYLFFLNQNVETEINQQLHRSKISLPDQDISRIAQDLSYNLFKTKELVSLGIQDRVRLCKEVKKRTGASLKQMARILHVPFPDLKRIFG